MQETTKEFLTKLAALMEEYDVEFEITETDNGWFGYSINGLEIGVPYEIFDDGAVYPNTEYVELSGRMHNAKDVLDFIEEKSK